MNKKIAVLLADGFEEIEAITPIDILRRLEFDLLIAGFADEVVGGHNLKVKSDILIDDLDYNELSAIILPGGLPGATNLRDSQTVLDLIKNMNEQNKELMKVELERILDTKELSKNSFEIVSKICKV